MILRYRSKNGIGRVDVSEGDDVCVLWTKLAQILKTDEFEIALSVPSSLVSSSASGKSKKTAIAVKSGRSVGSLGLKHGDMLDISVAAGCAPPVQHSAAAPAVSLKAFEAPIDEYVSAQSGEISRGRSNLCHHGPKGMCEYCTPLAAYDQTYLDEQKIKHMSFHAFLRQMLDKNKVPAVSSPHFVPPLDEDDFKLKQPCPSGHAAYPLGICSKCQPSAVTLQQQQFRLVDYVEFESASCVEQLLHFWRETGTQRFGVLLGRYEPYLEVPLGVKAVVAAVYEPPQSNFADGIVLESPANLLAPASVLSTAANLGLQVLGSMYTDCIDDGSQKGQVVCKRHAGSYFLSGAEALFAAEMQNRLPVRTRYSATGTFGSRYITCVISGNAENQIDIFTYQISNSGMAMVRDGIVEASVDPSLVRVRTPASASQYIPEVFFKYKNEYNIDVKQVAKPVFPVDYLLVTVAHGFPAQPQPTFASLSSFPVENRHGASTDSLASLFKASSKPSEFARVLSDFHLLLYIKELGVFTDAEYGDLCKVAVSDPANAQTHALVHKILGLPNWNTLAMLVSPPEPVQKQPVAPAVFSSDSIPFPPLDAGNSSTGPSAIEIDDDDGWSCPHCTFFNEGPKDGCAVCGLPPS